MTPGVAACRALARLYDVEFDELWDAIESNGAANMPNVSMGWWSNYEALEQSAVSVRTWEPLVVPGLLQTRDYAAALLGGDDDLVSRRMDRQQIVTRPDNPVDLVAILDESTLRRPVGGPAVMVDQLDHLVAMSQRPNVTVQVLPRTASAHALMLGGNGAFVILGLPWPGGLVHLEHIGGARSLDTSYELETHAQAFDQLRELALPPNESVNLIQAAAKELAQ